MRRRRHSGTRQGTQSGQAAAGSGVGSERAAQLKSPVTSEGHDEWETASESSDVGDRPV